MLRCKLPGPYFVKRIVSDFKFYALFMHFYALFMHFYALWMHFCAFLCIIPKWFLTITCTIWLRLQFRGQDSAQNFGAHLLFFHAPGWILGPWVRFSGLGVDIPARGRFWLVLGSRKDNFVMGSFCEGLARKSILPK